MDRFKYFLINENRTYLGRRVNDVLTSLQDVQEDMPNLGSRHLTKLADQIVNQIRKILHVNWDVANQKHLLELQKIAVALQKTIEEKGDLREILPAATQAVQTLAGKLGIKVNDLKSPEMGGTDIKPDDFEVTGDGPQQKQEQPPADQSMGQPPMGQQPMDQSMGPSPMDQSMGQPPAF